MFMGKKALKNFSSDTEEKMIRNKKIPIENLSGVYYRKERNEYLLEALDLMGLHNMYKGAVFSTTIDFNAAYNTKEQRKVNDGARTEEEINAVADQKIILAQENFLLACSVCEFRETCTKKIGKKKIFWHLLENAKIWGRLRGRLKSADVRDGYKSAPCEVLLRAGRLKKSDWTY